MADVKRTSVEWLGIEPYNSVLIDSYDGWATTIQVKNPETGVSAPKTVRDLHAAFNIEEITEDVFRTRLKNSNVRVPIKMAADFEKSTKA